MAKQIECGKFAVIEANAIEMYAACGSPGVCDFCGEEKFRGAYIAVINSWYCDKCFAHFKETAHYYESDKEIEQKNFDYYARLLGVKRQ